MHISLDSALGRQRRLNSVGESVLQIAPDAAAAYSLRSLTGGDPDVVRVRRESDNTEKDFSGSQIESGEMARWVNEQPTLPLDLRELDTNTGERDGALIQAAAAYSLRKLKEDFTGDVVEVRRSSDDATQSFTAAEVADGTLEDWVNADVTIYQSNFSSNTNGWDGSSVVSLAGNQDGVSDGITSKDNVLKLTKNQDSQAYISRDQGVIAGLTYTVSGSFYAPSSNTAVDGILIKDGVAGTSLSIYPSGYLTSGGVWTDFSFSYTATVSGTQRINMGISSLGSNPNGSSTGSTGDVVYISDLQFVETTSNGHVKTWYDQSGSTPSNDAVQTDAAKQPKIVENGDLVTGGMRFDDNQFLETTNTFTYGSGTTLSTFITNSSDGDDSSYLLRFASDYIIYNTGGGGRRVFAGTNASAGNVTTGEELWTTISELNTAGGTSNFYVDGTLESAADAAIGTNTVSNRVLNIGGSAPSTHWNGTVDEVILYDSDQTDNRTAIEANIGETYGITAIPAANDTVNGYVQTWYDQSGEGNDAEQISADKQPKIVGEVTSGQPHAFLGAIEFDGVDDYFALTSNLTTQPFSTFAAYSATQNSSYIYSGGTLPAAGRRSNGSYVMHHGSLLASGTHPSTEILGTYFANLTSSEIFSNGASVVSGDAGNTSNTIQYVFGRPSDAFGGTAKELIIYNTDQSANREAIETNIADEYGITLS